MSWKGLREENQMEICIEKCASVHGFVCMRFGIETVTFIETFTKRPFCPIPASPIIGIYASLRQAQILTRHRTLAG